MKIQPSSAPRPSAGAVNNSEHRNVTPRRRLRALGRHRLCLVLALAAVGVLFGLVGVAPAYAATPSKPVATAPRGTVRAIMPTFAWSKATGASSYELRVYKGSKLLLKKTGAQEAVVEDHQGAAAVRRAHLEGARGQRSRLRRLERELRLQDRSQRSAGHRHHENADVSVEQGHARDHLRGARVPGQPPAAQKDRPQDAVVEEHEGAAHLRQPHLEGPRLRRPQGPPVEQELQVQGHPSGHEDRPARR